MANNEEIIHNMKIRQSVVGNMPYDASGSSLLRSGDVRRGGFGPAALLPLLPLVPVVEKIFGRPISKLTDKLWSALGLGNGGSLMRSGGAETKFWHKSGDIGKHFQALGTNLHKAPVRNALNSNMGGSDDLDDLDALKELSDKDIGRLKLLEKKLMPLVNDKPKFMAKLEKIHSQGAAWFKKQKVDSNKKKYKLSKRYSKKKAVFKAKYPNLKYKGSAKYAKHKSVYEEHHSKKKRS